MHFSPSVAVKAVACAPFFILCASSPSDNIPFNDAVSSHKNGTLNPQFEKNSEAQSGVMKEARPPPSPEVDCPSEKPTCEARECNGDVRTTHLLHTPLKANPIFLHLATKLSPELTSTLEHRIPLPRPGTSLHLHLLSPGVSPDMHVSFMQRTPITSVMHH